MITKLKPGKYKLIDKENYFEASCMNPLLHRDFFKDDVVEIYKVDDGDGRGITDDGKYGAILISSNEYEFFELYEEPAEEPVLPEQRYWDGLETVQPGMVVGHYGNPEVVIAVRGEDVCLSDGMGLNAVHISYLEVAEDYTEYTWKDQYNVDKVLKIKYNKENDTYDLLGDVKSIPLSTLNQLTQDYTF